MKNMNVNESDNYHKALHKLIAKLGEGERSASDEPLYSIDEIRTEMENCDWLTQQELNYLRDTGTLDVVLERMEHETNDDFQINDAL